MIDTVTSVIGWNIDSISGVWILGGTFIAYCVTCLVISFANNWRIHRGFRKAHEAREKYQLQAQKDREAEKNGEYSK